MVVGAKAIQISDAIVHIVDILMGSTYVIGLHGDPGATFQLPKQFKPTPYDYDGAKVKLSEAIDIEWEVLGGSTVPPIHLTKADNPFRATLTLDAGDLASLQVYVKFHE